MDDNGPPGPGGMTSLRTSINFTVTDKSGFSNIVYVVQDGFKSEPVSSLSFFRFLV